MFQSASPATNNGTVRAKFNCYDQTAKRTDGTIVDTIWLGFGNGGSSCDWSELETGEARSGLRVPFHEVNGLGITEITIPGNTPVAVLALAY